MNRNQLLQATHGEMRRAVRRFRAGGFEVRVRQVGPAEVLIFDCRKEYVKLNESEAGRFLGEVEALLSFSSAEPSFIQMFVASVHLEQHLQLALDLSA